MLYKQGSFDIEEDNNIIDSNNNDLPKDGNKTEDNKTANKTETEKPWRFKKGQSGNPNGRPKTDPEVKNMLKAAAPDMVKLLIDTANNEHTKIELRIECANRILDRVYGKPTQPIDGNIDSNIVFTFVDGLEDFAK